MGSRVRWPKKRISEHVAVTFDLCFPSCHRLAESTFQRPDERCHLTTPHPSFTASTSHSSALTVPFSQATLAWVIRTDVPCHGSSRLAWVIRTDVPCHGSATLAWVIRTDVPCHCSQHALQTPSEWGGRMALGQFVTGHYNRAVMS